MKNNNLSKISVDTNKLPRARFNKPYDVNTTADWGSMQPHVCQFMYPNTKNVCQVESLTRLAPMLAPTFGRVQYKEFHQFVDVEDIWPPFPNMIAGEAYNGSTNYVPKCVPRIPLAYLSCFVLCGAKFTIYVANSLNSGVEYDTNQRTILYNALPGSALNSSASTAVANVKSALLVNYNDSLTGNYGNIKHVGTFDYQNGPIFDVTKLLDSATRTFIKSKSSTSYNILLPIYLPLGNEDDKSWFRPVQGLEKPDYDGFDESYVTLDGADMVIPLYISDSQGTSLYYLACRLSSFGKRIRKQLLGCGYQVNLQSREIVSVLPLFAQYKAYYDIFGLTSLSNYEATPLARLIQHLAYNNYANIDDRIWYSNSTGSSDMNMSLNYFKDFILSLGDLWYTDSQDFISAHQTNTSYANGNVAGVSVTGNNKYISPELGDNIEEGGYNANILYNEGKILTADSNSTPLNFSHLDIETLKRLYRWSNVRSVFGRSVAKELIAQGYQHYVDSCKSNFIGSDAHYITINDVVSTSDTYDESSKSGSILGEYGGKGIGYEQTKPFVFETDKFGYWIGFFTIIPKSGMSQGLDLTLLDTERYDFHNPSFDGLGYQMDSKAVVNERVDFYSQAGTPTAPDPFGLIPRTSEWKVSKNISNGDFSLRSTRNTYQPYCLDKEMPVGERFINFISDGGTGVNDTLLQDITKIMPLGAVPTAGDVWRYVSRYPWIGTFNRIFANFNSDNIYNRARNVVLTGYDNYMPIVNEYDNFLVHIIVNLTSFAPMLPIENTFGTDDDGSFDGSVDKA